MAERNKEVELLKELIRATEEERVTWRPTARVNEFTASFRGHLSVLISKGDRENYHLRLLDEDDRELLHLSGAKLIDFSVNSRDSVPLATLAGWPGESLSKLFDLARRNGLKVDKAIDEILQGLKSA